MSTMHERNSVAELRHDLALFRGNWLWFVLVGISLIVLGCLALGAIGIATLASVLVFGILLTAGGIAETIGAFWSRGWSGFFNQLLSGLLSLVVGLLFLRAPGEAMLVLTMLLAVLLMVGGLFKIIAAFSYRFAAWVWTMVSGIIDLVLGLMVLFGLPTSALWVIGLFVGISLLFRGFNWIGLGMVDRSLPRAT